MMTCPLYQKLELKIFPVAVFAVCATLMLLCAWFFPSLAIRSAWRMVVALLTVLIGITLILSGIYTFKKAQTTKSPNNLEATSHLVTWGVYRFTRNPMYLGGACIATSTALLIGNWSAFGFVLLFIVYINEFQIKPEERFLREKFPTLFIHYTRQTRRWI